MCIVIIPIPSTIYSLHCYSMVLGHRKPGVYSTPWTGFQSVTRLTSYCAYRVQLLVLIDEINNKLLQNTYFILYKYIYMVYYGLSRAHRIADVAKTSPLI